MFSILRSWVVTVARLWFRFQLRMMHGKIHVPRHQAHAQNFDELSHWSCVVRLCYQHALSRFFVVVWVQDKIKSKICLFDLRFHNLLGRFLDVRASQNEIRKPGEAGLTSIFVCCGGELALFLAFLIWWFASSVDELFKLVI